MNLCKCESPSLFCCQNVLQIETYVRSRCAENWSACLICKIFRVFCANDPGSTVIEIKKFIVLAAVFRFTGWL